MRVCVLGRSAELYCIRHFFFSFSRMVCVCGWAASTPSRWWYALRSLATCVFFFLLGDGRSQILKLELRHCGYGQTRFLNLDDGARASR